MRGSRDSECFALENDLSLATRPFFHDSRHDVPCTLLPSSSCPLIQIFTIFEHWLTKPCAHDRQSLALYTSNICSFQHLWLIDAIDTESGIYNLYCQLVLEKWLWKRQKQSHFWSISSFTTCLRVDLKNIIFGAKRNSFWMYQHYPGLRNSFYLLSFPFPRFQLLLKQGSWWEWVFACPVNSHVSP